MEFCEGMVVRSTAGRDKNRFYVIVALEADRIKIADGKRHLLCKAKAKNAKHLVKTNTVVSLSENRTDKKLRALLHPFNYGEQAVSID